MILTGIHFIKTDNNFMTDIIIIRIVIVRMVTELAVSFTKIDVRRQYRYIEYNIIYIIIQL